MLGGGGQVAPKHHAIDEHTAGVGLFFPNTQTHDLHNAWFFYAPQVSFVIFDSVPGSLSTPLLLQIMKRVAFLPRAFPLNSSDNLSRSSTTTYKDNLTSLTTSQTQDFWISTSKNKPTVERGENQRCRAPVATLRYYENRTTEVLGC